MHLDMVEVFSTNIHDPEIARVMIGQIHRAIPGCAATIDLEDCDRVLRVERLLDFDTLFLIGLLADFGYKIAVLPDEAPPSLGLDNLLKSA
jgi:hypothetical protein